MGGADLYRTPDARETDEGVPTTWKVKKKMNKCLAVLLGPWSLCELRAEGPKPVTSWKARMPETSGCWLGSGAVTSLLASTLECVQHCGIYSGHRGVPRVPSSHQLLVLKGRAETCRPAWSHQDVGSLLLLVEGRRSSSNSMWLSRPWVLLCDWQDMCLHLGHGWPGGRGQGHHQGQAHLHGGAHKRFPL